MHDLRHEALSRPADDGVPVHELQMLAGHAIITTAQRYMNARANSLAESTRQARQRRAERVAHQSGDNVQVGENAFEALPIVSHLSAKPILAADDSRNLRNCSGKWWRGTESNCRHYDFQSYALPTELPRHKGTHAQARPKMIARVRPEVGLRFDVGIAENPERVCSRSRRTPRSRCG